MNTRTGLLWARSARVKMFPGPDGRIYGSRAIESCYSFDFLTPSFDAAHFRDLITRLGVADSNFWGCWAFSNHDVVRAASRLGGGMALPTLSPASVWRSFSVSGERRACTKERLSEETDVPFERMVDSPAFTLS